MTKLRWILALLVACCVAAASPAMAAPTYDFIMVGDSRHALDAKMLHDARVRLEKIRSDLGLSSEDLPVDKYDASKPGQRAAIQRLGIPMAKLPFIGLCRTGGSDHLPVKVIWGNGPVHDLDQAIASVMQAASREIGVAIPTSAGGGPVSVARGFFVALVNNRDNEAWRSLSARSQNYIIQQITAQGNGLDEATVRAYFDKGDATILKAFFDAFRKGLSVSDVANSKFTLVSSGDLRAKVYSNVANEEHQWLLSKENTEWKFDFMETLLPDKFPEVASTNPTVPATNGDSAAAARAFFEAIAHKNYTGAWNALTVDTQEEFVRAVAEQTKLSVTEIRKEFRNGDDMKAFWDSFRTSSKTDQVLTGPFTEKSTDGDQAIVEFIHTNLPNPVELKMYQAGGKWKVAWKETFFPNGMPHGDN